MKLIIDTDAQTLSQEEAGTTATWALYSTEAFERLSRQWLALGWNQKYTYTFSWLGRPIIQLPEDLIRIQEVIYRTRPDVIVEVGVAHGGSLVFYATLCLAMGKGRVIGVDIDIRKHNRLAIEQHELYPYITLIEGDSVAPATVAQVQALVQPGESALLILDSCHVRQHVLAELEAYQGLVGPGSYLVVADGIMQHLAGTPRGSPHWSEDNPQAAARDFAARHPDFAIEQPAWLFNESELRENVTYWPGAYLKKR